MRFTESEIQWASRLRGAGLRWEPQAGHYVFDINGVMRAGSPFQAGVYFVTSANALEAAAGGRDEMLEGFSWLPTWEDARSWLVDHGASNEDIVGALRAGLADGLSDRESLYRLILDRLERKAAPAT